MAIRYNMQINCPVLEVMACGFDENYEETLSYATNVIQNAIENSCKGVLINELNIEYRISILETYQLAEKKH